MSGVILALRPRALGDVVLATPALASLAAGTPGAALHVVTESRFVPLLEGLPFVTKVWALERTLTSTLAMIRSLRALRPDVAVDFFGNSRTAAIARGSGARRVFGYDLRGRKALYDVAVPRELRGAGDRREYAAAVHLRLARAAGGADGPLQARIVVGEPARAAAAELFARAGVVRPEHTIGLVAAGSWATKMWPLANSALLARRLLEAGHEVLAIAGPGEAGLHARLSALAPGIAVLPPCGVAALAAVIERLRGVAGTDSGPRHLAAALGVPSFAWFGPTHPATWNPPGPAHGFWRTDLPCRACDLTACPHWNCLPALAAGQGAALVLEHFARHGRGPQGAADGR